MKETTSFLKKDYSTSVYENNIASNYLKEDKPRGMHISTKSISINDKNNLDSLYNFRNSPSPHIPFKKYSISPNKQNPLESIIAENSDFFEEDNFDPISYRDKYLNENIYSNTKNELNYNDNSSNLNQKITVRTSNTNANINTIANNLLVGNQVKSIKNESKLISNNNTSNIQTGNINGNNKKTTFKKGLNLNNNNNYDPNIGNLVSSVKNSINNKNSMMNGSGANFHSKNSNKNLNFNNSKDNYKMNQNNNFNIKTNKFKNLNTVIKPKFYSFQLIIQDNEKSQNFAEKQKLQFHNNIAVSSADCLIDLENKFSEIMIDYKDNLESFYYDGLERIQSIFDEKVNKIIELNNKYDEIKTKHQSDIILSSLKVFY